MHEMGIVAEIIDELETLCKDNNLTSLKSITVDVGEASMVVPSFLLECWSASIYDTPFKDTEMRINLIESKGKCNECGAIFPIKANNQICPHCGTKNDFVTVTGLGIEIDTVEAL